MDLRDVGIFDRFSSGGLDLEVTQIGKTCHGDTCAIFREVGKCVMPSEGIFCRVLQPGRLKAGDKFTYRPVPLAIRIITLSDRASRGEYEDRSGPAIEGSLSAFLADRPWHPAIERSVLPDDPARLERELAACYEQGCDILITTGGTGVGPRDFTPEAITSFCDRIIPGIMESIRTRYAADNPRAALSRSVAGVKGHCLVYALPGSVRAVSEYMEEILKTLEHLLVTVRGIDPH
jgi:molybdenum cofactor synthesis domain-containing protein